MRIRNIRLGLGIEYKVKEDVYVFVKNIIFLTRNKDVHGSVSHKPIDAQRDNIFVVSYVIHPTNKYKIYIHVQPASQ